MPMAVWCGASSISGSRRASATRRATASLTGPGGSFQPGSVSSTAKTVLPAFAAAIAAESPAGPRPTTSTSGNRCTRSRSRGTSDTLTLPRPATWRMIGSTFGHAHFGLISVL